MISIIPTTTHHGQPEPGLDPDNYCTAGDNDDYTLVVTMGAATVPAKLGGGYDKIRAFDACEAAAGIGEISLSKISSFSGPVTSIRGRVWGADMGISMFQAADRPMWADQSAAPVYGLTGLLTATGALFGSRGKLRFPVLPGELVTAAYETAVTEGPALVWASLAIGIPADDQPAEKHLRLHARLLMEDAGAEPGRPSPEQLLPVGPSPRLVRAVRSVELLGAERGITYSKIFAGGTQVTVPEGHIGCAGVFGLYLRLAENAIPGSDLRTLPAMSLDEWQQHTARAGVVPVP